MSKIETIKLQGKDYAQVKDRVKAFRSEVKNGSIQTSYDFRDGYVIFKAELFVQDALVATGHSFGVTKSQKAFEKLETISVGRALALSGYCSDGEIASYEEIEDVEEVQVKVLAELTPTNPKWADAIKKMRNEDLEPEYFETWFTISPETKNLMKNEVQN